MGWVLSSWYEVIGVDFGIWLVWVVWVVFGFGVVVLVVIKW